jgi:hypothetical protein
MMPSPSGNLLASRFLEPLERPWAVIAGGLAGGGLAGWSVLGGWLRLGWRLLHLLLSL